MIESPIDIRISDNKVIFSWRSKTFQCQLLGNTKPHNDHLALAAICAFNPYFNKKHINQANLKVSDRFRKAVASRLPYVSFQEGSVDEYVGSVPMLSYSSGIDSAVAAHLMGGGVALYLIGRKTAFDSYAVEGIKKLRSKGWKAFTCHCTVQSVRSPYGFPTDICCATQCMVNANHFKGDSIAYGTILESAYNIGRGPFQEYINRHHFTFWNALHTAAGLPFNQVTAGLSEVVTNNIKKQENLHGQSCIRGYRECKRCYKCFRRYLLNGELLQRSSHTNRNISIGHHLNILRYADYKHAIKVLQKYPTTNMGYFERWYSPSIDLLPVKYRDQIANSILTYTDAMNDDDERNLKSYKQ